MFLPPVGTAICNIILAAPRGVDQAGELLGDVFPGVVGFETELRQGKTILHRYSMRYTISRVTNQSIDLASRIQRQRSWVRQVDPVDLK